ncbi:MAG: TSUP family transporter [Clostridia bacterium]|nr:TSUP family transporter [Clostridia bacterium]
MEFSRKGQFLGAGCSGLAAGLLNGLFGGGGGMLLIPGLKRFARVEEQTLFPMSVSVMLPVSLLSLGISAMSAPLPWMDVWPYLVGSAAGGVAVGIWGRRIPVLWLHRILGVMLLWGGWRYLW